MPGLKPPRYDGRMARARLALAFDGVLLAGCFGLILRGIEEKQPVLQRDDFRAVELVVFPVGQPDDAALRAKLKLFARFYHALGLGVAFDDDELLVGRVAIGQAYGGRSRTAPRQEGK